MCAPAAAMGMCLGAPNVKAKDIIPDPTGPSTFFLQRQNVLSSNYKVWDSSEHTPTQRHTTWYCCRST